MEDDNSYNRLSFAATKYHALIGLREDRIIVLLVDLENAAQ
jgi:hypothetical protein